MPGSSQKGILPENIGESARAFTLLAALLSLANLSAQTIQVNKDNKTIAITSTDSAEREADLAEVSIGFIAYGADQDATYADASRTSNRIIEALLASGVKRDQIASDSQSLTALDEQDKLRCAKGSRFIFKQTWKVTAKASSASDVLHLAISAGANDSGNIDWRLADDNALEAEAAEKALNHARQIAERMAEGLHAKLGPLVYASNQMPQRLFFGATHGTVSAGVSATKVNLKPLAIVPDKVSRSATVYAVFAGLNRRSSRGWHRAPWSKGRPKCLPGSRWTRRRLPRHSPRPIPG